MKQYISYFRQNPAAMAAVIVIAIPVAGLAIFAAVTVAMVLAPLLIPAGALALVSIFVVFWY